MVKGADTEGRRAGRPQGAKRARYAVLTLLAVALSACAVEDHSWRYGQKGDSRPHPGVASASRYPIHGIDVSRWQGDIDWRAVRQAGTRFVFIKATEGGDHIDPRFRANWEGAKAAGIPHGAYHFVYWCRPAHEQAQWFVQHIPVEANALPPVLDVEWNGHSRTCPRKVPAETAREKMRLMLAELERHTGKTPIIYTDITFHKDVIEGTTEFDRYPFWIRSTAARPEERYRDRPWEFWQYTTTGRVPGINGDVDRNAFFGSEQEFLGWLAGDYDIGERVWSGSRPFPRMESTAPVVSAMPTPMRPHSTQTPSTFARPEPLPEPAEDAGKQE
jgi:lysozyme